MLSMDLASLFPQASSFIYFFFKSTLFEIGGLSLKQTLHSNICLLCYQYYELHSLAPPVLKDLLVLRFMWLILKSCLVPQKKYQMTFFLNLASCERQNVHRSGTLLLPHLYYCLQWRMFFGKWWAERMKRNGLSFTLWDYVICLTPGHKFTWPLTKGEQVLFYFSGNLLEFMCYRSLLQAGWFSFLSFAFVCVKNIEYFNQYSYRNWCGLVLSDSRNSLRTDMMVDSLLHAQWRGSQCLLPCMAACLDADGWLSNKPNYFWFCMKLISMQGCWFAVCISNGFFFSSLSFSFFSPFCLPWTHLDRCQSYSR